MSVSKCPIRFGVVGFGFGENHVRTLANMSKAKLVAVADDHRSDQLKQASERYGFRPYRNAAKMIASEDLDAITVCVPPAGRQEILQAGLDAGLAMFVEKPWASNSTHARELAAMCRHSSRPVMPGFSFRFHPAIVRLREVLTSDLGRPRMLQGQYVFGWLPPADHWAWDPDNGNGFLNENSCHLFDAVCSLMGLAPLADGHTDWALLLELVAPHLPEDSWVILEHILSPEQGREDYQILMDAAARAGVELS